MRYSEVDAAQIVFYPHYLTYLDITASEFFSEGLKSPGTAHAGDKGASYIVKKSTVGDWLNVWCRVAEIKTSGFTMEFIITRDEDDSPLVKAWNVMVSYNFSKNEVQPIPDFLRQAIEKIEAGEAWTL